MSDKKMAEVLNLPWRVEKITTDNDYRAVDSLNSFWVIKDSRDWIIVAHVPLFVAKAITRAVNEHDEMRELIQGVLSGLDPNVFVTRANKLLGDT